MPTNAHPHRVALTSPSAEATIGASSLTNAGSGPSMACGIDCAVRDCAPPGGGSLSRGGADPGAPVIRGAGARHPGGRAHGRNARGHVTQAGGPKHAVRPRAARGAPRAPRRAAEAGIHGDDNIPHECSGLGLCARCASADAAREARVLSTAASGRLIKKARHGTAPPLIVEIE